MVSEKDDKKTGTSGSSSGNKLGFGGSSGKVVPNWMKKAKSGSELLFAFFLVVLITTFVVRERLVVTQRDADLIFSCRIIASGRFGVSWKLVKSHMSIYFLNRSLDTHFNRR